jgi:hypothetical protein
MGPGELLEIITNDANNRIPLAARSILKVLAAQYSVPRDRLDRLEGIQVRTWSGCLDRVGAEATHDRRQEQARQHYEAGQSIPLLPPFGFLAGLLLPFFECFRHRLRLLHRLLGFLYRFLRSLRGGLLLWRLRCRP